MAYVYATCNIIDVFAYFIKKQYKNKNIFINFRSLPSTDPQLYR